MCKGRCVISEDTSVAAVADEEQLLGQLRTDGGLIGTALSALRGDGARIAHLLSFLAANSRERVAIGQREMVHAVITHVSDEQRLAVAIDILHVVDRAGGQRHGLAMGSVHTGIHAARSKSERIADHLQPRPATLRNAQVTCGQESDSPRLIKLPKVGAQFAK